MAVIFHSDMAATVKGLTVVRGENRVTDLEWSKLAGTIGERVTLLEVGLPDDEDIATPPPEDDDKFLAQLDPDNVPNVGDPLIFGPNRTFGRGDPVDFFGVFAPLAVDYGSPLVLPLGPAPDHLCFQTTLAGDLTLADPEGAAATIRPGLFLELVVISDGARTLVAVPATWHPAQAVTPALAQGAGARTSILVNIREVDASGPTITRADYIVIPGPDAE